jgi:hypothetical protein
VLTDGEIARVLVDTGCRLAYSRVGDNLGLGASGSVLEDLVLDATVFEQVPLVKASCRYTAAVADKGNRREEIQQSCLHIDWI